MKGIFIVDAETAQLKKPGNFLIAANFQENLELFELPEQKHLAQTSSKHLHLAKALRSLMCLDYHVKAGTYNRENPLNPGLKYLEFYQVPKSLLRVFLF